MEGDWFLIFVAEVRDKTLWIEISWGKLNTFYYYIEL
jgi:hypothetical protein